MNASRGAVLVGVVAMLLLPLGAPRAQADGKPAAAGKVDAPPPARTVDAVDHAFGLTLPDPYRWMEGNDNAEFDA